MLLVSQHTWSMLLRRYCVDEVVKVVEVPSRTQTMAWTVSEKKLMVHWNTPQRLAVSHDTK